MEIIDAILYGFGKATNLHDYPLNEKYESIEAYLSQKLDYEKIRSEIVEKKAAVFDVSDAVKLFPHLSLDENYRLLCYMGREYHGLFGWIAAIGREEDGTPLFTGLTLMNDTGLALPDCAADPLEAVYHDGTPWGCLEALLLDQLLNRLPYNYYGYPHEGHFLPQPPEDWPEAWDLLIDLKDWAFRQYERGADDYSVLIIERFRERPFHASDGLDPIILKHYHFYSGSTYLRHVMKTKTDKAYSFPYHASIPYQDRYGADRHCCVYSCQTLQIAKQQKTVCGW